MTLSSPQWRSKRRSTHRDYADLAGPVTATDHGSRNEVGIIRRSA
jgi:hypothetical protein